MQPTNKDLKKNTMEKHKAQYCNSPTTGRNAYLINTSHKAARSEKAEETQFTLQRRPKNLQKYILDKHNSHCSTDPKTCLNTYWTNIMNTSAPTH